MIIGYLREVQNVPYEDIRKHRTLFQNRIRRSNGLPC
jgi:hypothetical protein